MKVKYYTMVFVLMLSACDIYTSGWRAEQAVELCKDHGGLDSISTFNYVIECNDGALLQAERPGK